MKKLQLWISIILLVCAVIYLGDFVIDGSHPFSELGAGISCLLVSAVFIYPFIRSKRSFYMSKQVRFIGTLMIALLFLGIAVGTFGFGNTKYHMIEGVLGGIISIGYFIVAFYLLFRQ